MAKKKKPEQAEVVPMPESVLDAPKQARKFTGLLRVSDEVALNVKRAAVAYDQSIGEFLDAEVLPILKALWYNRTMSQLAEAKRLAENVTIRITADHPILYGLKHYNRGELIQVPMDIALNHIKAGVSEIVVDADEIAKHDAD